jgi:protein-tyrosine phosphatase
MDEDNYSNVLALASRSGETRRVHYLREWDPQGRGAGVPDPYYGGSNGFEDVHDIVERSCTNLLDHLLGSPEAE